MAQEGSGASIIDMESMPAPFTFVQLKANKERFKNKVEMLDRRVRLLPVVGKAKEASYMKFRLARMRACLLATEFLWQTMERQEAARTLVVNRNLLVKTTDDGDKYSVFSPVGCYATKREARCHVTATSLSVCHHHHDAFFHLPLLSSCHCFL